MCYHVQKCVAEIPYRVPTQGPVGYLMVTYKPVVICRATDLERFLKRKMKDYYVGMPPYSRIHTWGDKENVNQLVSSQPCTFNFFLF